MNKKTTQKKTQPSKKKVKKKYTEQEDRIRMCEVFTQMDLDRAYRDGFYDGYELAMREIAHDKFVKNGVRTERAADKLRSKKKKKIAIIEAAYIRLHNSKKIENLSENKIAECILDFVTGEIKTSKSAIKEILRDSTRLKTYPWKRVSP